MDLKKRIKCKKKITNGFEKSGLRRKKKYKKSFKMKGGWVGG